MALKKEQSEAIEVKLSLSNMKATENQPETEKNGSQCLGTMNSNVTLSEPDDGKSLLELENSEIESFYQRLNKLHNSSGPNLLFDLRQTTLDLHLFTKKLLKEEDLFRSSVSASNPAS
ncbi:Cyclase family protein [Prunus dulcis]|uniref:Cyclase family protein n=1 Tax=Prunus dulcis TaxID=3755 RepID=A0A4Y1S0H2_PRUDU|nr:Cyclase family protein [Prunus dulcis]